MADHLIVPLPDAALVFGIDWFPLVGRKAVAAGRRLVRRHRASHMLLVGSPPAAVGMATIKGGPAKRPLYSAAQNLALLHPRGTYAALLELPDRGCWLAVVHDGVVVSRTDKLYRTRQDAVQLLAEIQHAFPRLQVLGKPGAPAQPDLEMLSTVRPGQSRLHATRRWHPLFPGPVQYFLLALAVAVLAPRLWALKPSRTSQTPPVIAHEDALTAWQQAVAQSFAGRAIHGTLGTRLLLDTLYALPLGVGGWTLVKVQCDAQPTTSWRCAARFERAAADASNLSFLTHARPDWSIHFTATEHASASWQIATPSQSLEPARLGSADDNDRALISSLQAIKPGFSHMQISSSSPLALVTPTNPAGQPVPRPSGLAIYHQRGIRTVGPLRSAAMLLPHTAHVGWRKAELAVASADRPTLTHSGLILTLEGAIYESSNQTSMLTIEYPATRRDGAASAS